MDDVPLPRPRLLGDHQLINASGVIAAISLIRDKFNITNDHIKTGLQKVQWPARLQKINDRLWVDGAHNSHGAQVLSVFCKDMKKPISLILGLTRNRNPLDFLQHFKGVAQEVFCVQVMSEVSSYSGSRLAELAAPAGIPVTACDSLSEALDMAKARKGGVVVVTGSLFLAADLLKLLA